MAKTVRLNGKVLEVVPRTRPPRGFPFSVETLYVESDPDKLQELLETMRRTADAVTASQDGSFS